MPEVPWFGELSDGLTAVAPWLANNGSSHCWRWLPPFYDGPGWQPAFRVDSGTCRSGMQLMHYGACCETGSECAGRGSIDPLLRAATRTPSFRPLQVEKLATSSSYCSAFRSPLVAGSDQFEFLELSSRPSRVPHDDVTLSALPLLLPSNAISTSDGRISNCHWDRALAGKRLPSERGRS